MWVLIVFTETDSSPAISGLDRFVGEIAQHLQLGRAEFLRR
jgi:hypothetical protein